MEDTKWQIDKLIDLYKAHLDLYAKAIAIFLAIASFTVKAAFDDAEHRRVLAEIGMATTVLIVIPAVFAAHYTRTLERDMKMLAAKIDIKAVSTLAMTGVIYTSAAYWLLLVGVWIMLFSMAN
jgi:hypothetical protein